MEIKTNKRLLFSKSDIASMLDTSLGIFRKTAMFLEVPGIDWKCKTQRFTDKEVFNIIRAIRKRFTDEEIDDLINNY